VIGLTADQKFLLYLLEHAVQGKQLQALPDWADPDWKAVVRESCAQTVTLPMFDVISPLQAEIPEEIYKKCFELARRFTAGNMRIEHAQTGLIQVLGEDPYVILKGQSAAAYYPVPELRQLGDVDFLVPTERTGEIAEKMKALGYTHSWEPGDYHQVLEKSGVCLEMHMSIAGMPEGDARPAVEEYLSTIYEESIPVEGMFGSFRAPCPAHHAIVLILHMQHHVVAWGMGLRHIMDWACFVNRTAEEPFWQERLLPLLKRIGLFRFTAVMTKMASVYLGSCCPSWAESAPEDVCRGLMEDLLASGNFGNKDADRVRSIDMLPDWEKKEKETGKLRLLYGTLKASVIRQNPSLEQKPVRRFFSMTGKTCRYLALYCCGKRPNLLKAASHADQRRSVYEELHMYEPEG